ncbi:Adaptive-response sensory-kinase SasA [subsurface metagenome]
MKGKPVYGQHQKLDIDINRKRENLRAIALIPVLHEGKVIACLNIASHFYDDVPANIRIALQTIAAQIGNVIARVNTAKKLKDSEEKYRQVVDYSLVGNYISQNYILKFCNQQLAKIFGYNNVDEMLEKDMRKMILSESPEFAYSEIQLRKPGEKDFSRYEFKGIKKDGSLIDIEVLGGRILYQGKHAMQGTLIDITERKRVNEALIKSEERLRFITENTGDVLYRLQYDTMTFDYLSPAIYTLTGYTAEEINKISFKSIINQTVIPGVPDVSSEELIKKRREGKTGEWRAEFKILSKGGEEKWLGDHSFPWKDDSGKIIGSTGILQNITEHKRTEEELKKYREHLEELVKERTAELEEKTRKIEESQKALTFLLEDVNEARMGLENANLKLKEANKELESFSYSVSHDLRAPLRAIHGFSAKFFNHYSNKVDDEGKRILKVISDNTQKMGQLIDDLLSFSRMGRTMIRKVDINMNDLLKETWNESKSYSPERKIRINIDTLPPLYGDRNMVRQILVNLLSNALKFTKFKKESTIEVGFEKKNSEIIYFVKDNGVGFDMQYAGKLFNVFQRLHDESEFKGTGVGLAIVRRIIQRHGGKVWTESKVNKGATFYFTIPNK